MEILSASTKNTQELAESIATKIKPGMAISLYGDLGSGKTTFTAFLVKALGFESRVQSPTFIIHRCYNKNSGDIKTIHHLDFYRLSDKEEVLDIGLDEMLKEPNALVLIEWPELAVELLPKDAIQIKFEVVDETSRKIYVQNLS